jgi:hypothetical protein
MAASTEIELIPASAFPGRMEGLIRECRPAIVTGLFAGQPISLLSSMAEVRERLGSTPITMFQNFADSKRENILDFLSGKKRRAESRPSTIAAYLDLAANAPEGRWTITEGPAPAELLATVDMRALGVEKIAGGFPERGAARAREKAYAVLFLGNAGNAADLHTDWDGNDALLYQGFGRKRVTIFPAAAAPLLHPIASFGTLRLSGMPEKARRAFLRYAGGVEHLLMPGEALFMPALCWHNIEYVDLSMSISFRFNGILDPELLFPIAGLHADLYLQNLMAGSRDPAKTEGVRAAMRGLRAASERRYASARAKYRALRALAREKCIELGLIYRDYPRQTWLDFEDIVDGTECAAYHALPNGSRLARWLWHNRQRGRSVIRRMANRVARWA